MTLGHGGCLASAVHLHLVAALLDIVETLDVNIDGSVSLVPHRSGDGARFDEDGHDTLRRQLRPATNPSIRAQRTSTTCTAT